MTDKERIEVLETQLALLTAQVNKAKIEPPWYPIGKSIDKRLIKMFDGRWSPTVASFKSSITSIVGKSFNTHTVFALNEEQLEKSKELINFILDFAETNRKEGD